MSRFIAKTVLVTGGGRGIGRATCLRLAGEGAAVAVVDRDIEPARAVVNAGRPVQRVATTLAASGKHLSPLAALAPKALTAACLR